MKKQWISTALMLLLMLLIPAAAWADVIYPAPEDFTVGVEVDHLLATLDPGGTVWTDPELLPRGCGWRRRRRTAASTSICGASPPPRQL